MLVRRFPRAIESLPLLVAFVREFFAERRWDPERAFDVDLVLEELFTNMVRHARGGTSEIEVGLTADDEALTVRLRDEGVEPWDPAQAPPVDVNRPLEERRPGGLGIHFIRQIARDLRVEHVNGATIVTAVLGMPR